jgi:hypothetical protein
MTTTHDDELSVMTLDTFWASGRSGASDVERHVAGCARCRAYLSGLEGLEREAVDAAPFAAAPRATGATPPIRPRRRLATLGAAGALACAAAVALVLHREGVPESYVGVKGTPAVQILVHRDATTRVWDGRSALRPGDALALRVACEGFLRVAVASPGPDGWVRLSDSGCPTDGGALPFTLRVDDAPGPERLAVVISHEPLDDTTLRKAIGDGTQGDGVWVSGFVLPKVAGVEP